MFSVIKKKKKKGWGEVKSILASYFIFFCGFFPSPSSECTQPSRSLVFFPSVTTVYTCLCYIPTSHSHVFLNFLFLALFLWANNASLTRASILGSYGDFSKEIISGLCFNLEQSNLISCTSCICGKIAQTDFVVVAMRILQDSDDFWYHFYVRYMRSTLALETCWYLYDSEGRTEY